MNLMAQPWKHPKTNVYYCRRSVPKDIRHAFGKTEASVAAGEVWRTARRSLATLLDFSGFIYLLFSTPIDLLNASLGSPFPGLVNEILPSTTNWNLMPGNTNEYRLTSSWTRVVSVEDERRNLRRAGRLPKRSETSMAVPGGQPCVPKKAPSPQCSSMRNPLGFSGWRVVMVVLDTAAILGRASPRNPRVAIASSCSWLSILLVA